MNVLKILIHFIEYIVFVYLGSAAVYTAVFAFAGIFARRKIQTVKTVTRKFAVLIPGYREDSVIVGSAIDALLQDYPREKYDVVIIADSFREETLRKLNTLPVKVIEVRFEASTKSKALNKAMQEIGEEYDIALILDADNLMEKEFLTKINRAFDNGFQVVQGHRIAKNLNTSFAILDAISEEINNHIFRKGHRNLGLSSALIGSGMAFDYMLFKHLMSGVNAVGGFDKELELKLLQKGIQIEYLHNARILDEKVQKPEVFARQRKRWLSAQFVYFSRFIIPGFRELFRKGNIDFFDKVYQMIAPPRVLLGGMTFLITLIYGTIACIDESDNLLVFGFKEWTVILLLVFITFLLSIPGRFYTRDTAKALAALPNAFFLMFLSLFRLKGANKTFIHTEHGK